MPLVNFYTPLKTSENQRFHGVFREYKEPSAKKWVNLFEKRASKYSTSLNANAKNTFTFQALEIFNSIELTITNEMSKKLLLALDYY